MNIVGGILLVVWLGLIFLIGFSILRRAEEDSKNYQEFDYLDDNEND